MYVITDDYGPFRSGEKVVYKTNFFSSWTFKNTDGLSWLDKFWPKRTNLRTQRRQICPNCLIWQSLSFGTNLVLSARAERPYKKPCKTVFHSHHIYLLKHENFRGILLRLKYPEKLINSTMTRFIESRNQLQVRNVHANAPVQIILPFEDERWGWQNTFTYHAKFSY